MLVLAGQSIYVLANLQEEGRRKNNYIYWKIYKGYDVQTADKWYEYDPKTVEEKNNIAILYEMPIHTDREISANRPDIVI